MIFEINWQKVGKTKSNLKVLKENEFFKENLGACIAIKIWKNNKKVTEILEPKNFKSLNSKNDLFFADPPSRELDVLRNNKFHFLLFNEKGIAEFKNFISKTNLGIAEMTNALNKLYKFLNKYSRKEKLKNI